ncbi:MAG: hypothetical protein ACXVGH_05705 [Mycobacteriales bacterium]
MPARRPAVTALVGAAALLSLAGCQKPSAGITLVSDRSSVHFQAQEFCRDGKALVRGDECPGTGPKGPQLFHVREGAEVGIDVDKKLADSGWYVVDLDARTQYAVQTTHYSAFQADFRNRPVAGVIHLEVRQVDHAPKSDSDVPKIVGQWKFQLIEKG